MKSSERYCKVDVYDFWLSGKRIITLDRKIQDVWSGYGEGLLLDKVKQNIK